MLRYFSIMLFVAIISFSYFACTPHRKTIPQEYIHPVAVKKPIPLSRKLLTQYIPHTDLYRFPPAVLQYKQQDWLIVLANNKACFYLFNLADSTKIDSVMIGGMINRQFFATQQGNAFYFYYPEKNQLEKRLLDVDSLVIASRYTLPSLPSAFVFSESSGFRMVDTASPAVLISYGAFSGRENNFRDPEGDLIILDPSSTTIQKWGSFPRSFFQTKQYYSGTLFTTDGEQAIYHLYELQDSVYKTSLNGKRLAAVALENDRDFNRFDWSKETNMGYVRRYSMETEKNERIELIQNKWLVIVKKLRREHHTDPQHYKYFVLDTSLQIHYADTLRPACYPVMIGEYKNGFLMLGDSLKNAYYYEIR